MDLNKFRALAQNWEAVGETDPLFGVLSDPAKHGGKWELDEFFDSGRAHVERLMRSLEDATATFERGTCLDFGCGVGRLTIPLSRHFTRTVGVDIADSMLDSARQFLRPSDHCEFIVNRRPDLRLFSPATFDVVHSCLALQHIPPEVSLQYIAEFFRVSRPGGLVVFQVPAETRSEREISSAQALPDGAHFARFAIEDLPRSIPAARRTRVTVVVTNDSPVPWPHDIPAGRHICLANHWLRDDGTVAIQDDARALLPRTIGPGEREAITLTVQAPLAAGSYMLEFDLVQEHVCWFAQKGSQTSRAAVEVTDAPAETPHEKTLADHPSASPRIPSNMSPFPATISSRRRSSLLKRIVRRIRGATPTFEMHVVPRIDVERVIASSGATLLRAIDDNAAGSRWLSYTYVCRR